MLVEVRAVEVAQAMLVSRKMRGHPVHDDADPATVQVIDEIHEILRSAIARRGCEVPGDLVTPGAVERVLHDRHQLHVREAHLGYVVAERVGQLAIGQRAVVFLRHPSPGAQVHLVYRHGRVERVCAGARLHPLVIAPFVRQVPDDGRGSRWQLGVEGERIRLVDAVTRVSRGDVILVDRSGGYSRNETFPDAGRIAARLERVGRGVPTVEVAHYRDGGRIRRPDTKVSTFYRAALPGLDRVSPQFLVRAHVSAFAKEINVLFR